MTEREDNEFSAQLLQELLQERVRIEPIRVMVPVLWKLLEAEIERVSAHVADSRAAALLSSMANDFSKPPSNNIRPSTPGVPLASPAPSGRKRVKLAVPSDRFPYYNFVGRLLGPRGITLKNLERDTSCKIMIRGKGSIRKDKEADVRGKPGYEHVFSEPLHVVIEAGDGLDEAAAIRALNRAKEAVELLLVPVPEERDSLKRQQLRDLAILNGTFRGANVEKAHSVSSLQLPSGGLGSSLGIPTCPYSSSTISAPSSASSGQTHEMYGIESMSPGFLGDNTAISSPIRNFPSAQQKESIRSCSGSVADHQNRHPSPGRYSPTRRNPGIQQFTNVINHRQSSDRNYGEDSELVSSCQSFSTFPSSRKQTHCYIADHVMSVVSDEGSLPCSDLVTRMNSLIVAENEEDSSLEESPEASKGSAVEDLNCIGNVQSLKEDLARSAKHEATQNTNVTKKPTLTAGGFLGQGFYNGAFSNNMSSSPWDRHSDCTVPTAGCCEQSPVPSPEIITTSSAVAALDLNNSHSTLSNSSHVQTI